MRKSRLTDVQIVAILREADKGAVAAAAKQHGVSELVAERDLEIDVMKGDRRKKL
jgi:hypothetical protein